MKRNPTYPNLKTKKNINKNKELNIKNKCLNRLIVDIILKKINMMFIIMVN